MSDGVKYIGQRVLVCGNEIAVVIFTPENQKHDSRVIWVRRCNGVECAYDPRNVAPLPNGQL